MKHISTSIKTNTNPDYLTIDNLKHTDYTERFAKDYNIDDRLVYVLNGDLYIFDDSSRKTGIVRTFWNENGNFIVK